VESETNLVDFIGDQNLKARMINVVALQNDVIDSAVYYIILIFYNHGYYDIRHQIYFQMDDTMSSACRSATTIR
jgi:hypothetical protein